MFFFSSVLLKIFFPEFSLFFIFHEIVIFAIGKGVCENIYLSLIYMYIQLPDNFNFCNWLKFIFVYHDNCISEGNLCDNSFHKVIVRSSIISYKNCLSGAIIWYFGYDRTSYLSFYISLGKIGFPFPDTLSLILFFHFMFTVLKICTFAKNPNSFGIIIFTVVFFKAVYLEVC